MLAVQQSPGQREAWYTLARSTHQNLWEERWLDGNIFF